MKIKKFNDNKITFIGQENFCLKQYTNLIMNLHLSEFTYRKRTENDQSNTKSGDYQINRKKHRKRKNKRDILDIVLYWKQFPQYKKIKININNITGLQFLSIFFNISKRKGQNKLNKYCCGLSLPK